MSLYPTRTCMTHPSKTDGLSGLGTSRMAVMLVLALVVNFGLLLAPLFFGTRGDSAVAANLSTSSAPQPDAITQDPVSQEPVTQDPVFASPPAETIVGDEPLAPEVILLPAPGDSVARVESPAPAEMPDDADSATPSSDSSSTAEDPPAPRVMEFPSELGSVPPPSPMPDFDPCILEIVNPAETNGPVHFVIAGAVHTLLPGESRQWLALSERQVEFHRGDDFGDISYNIERGTWRFQVTDAGWELIAAEHVSMFVQP